MTSIRRALTAHKNSQWRLRSARLLAFMSVLLLVTTVYLQLCRPCQLHWGATAAEIERSMAGDELNPNPSFLATLCTFLTSLALLFWRRLTWRTWGAGLLAGMIWLTTWYAPILIWFSVLLALIAIGALFLAHRPVTGEHDT